MKEWTEEEDLKLRKALEEHEYCWSKIAACVPPRTDSQCRRYYNNIINGSISKIFLRLCVLISFCKNRRWKALFPEEVRMLKVARTMKKAALISNFVDREGERPDLTIKDFVPLLQIESDHKDNEDQTISNKKKQRYVFQLLVHIYRSGIMCHVFFRQTVKLSYLSAELLRDLGGLERTVVLMKMMWQRIMMMMWMM